MALAPSVIADCVPRVQRPPAGPVHCDWNVLLPAELRQSERHRASAAVPMFPSWKPAMCHPPTPAPDHDRNESQQEDYELAVRIRDGDHDAYSYFYEREYDRVLGRTRCILGSEAEDAVQSGFLKVWRNHEAIDPSKSLQGYLNTTVRRTALDLCRKLSRWKTDTAELLLRSLSTETHDSMPAHHCEALELVRSLPFRDRTIAYYIAHGMSRSEAMKAVALRSSRFSDELKRVKDDLAALGRRLNREAENGPGQS